MIPRLLSLVLILILAITGYCFFLLDRNSPSYASEASAVLTLTLAMLTAAYVVVTTMQWAAMRRALDTTERPWVVAFLEGWNFEPHGGSRVRIRLRNAGRSLAFVEFALEGSSEPVPPEVRNYESGITILGGHDEQPLLPHIITLTIPTVADLAEVRAGTRQFFIWIFIRYTDPLRQDRFTQMGWQYAAEHHNFVPCHGELQIFR